MSRPLTWDTEGVFSESKNLVFIDRLIAATANGNRGTYIQNTDDLAEWTLYAEGSKKKMVSIRLKDGQVHVHPDFDREYLSDKRSESNASLPGSREAGWRSGERSQALNGT